VEEMGCWMLENRKTYGTRQMLGVGLAKFLRIGENPFLDFEEEHCSMSQAAFIKRFAASSIYFGKAPSLLAPKDVFEACQKSIAGYREFL